MSEYWKSTPSYWCKFCSQYVRDTSLERKNHESTLRHQNNIQRSIRELSKTKEREQREQDRAKAEVARLNGLVNGEKKNATPSGKGIFGVKDVGGSKSAAAPPGPVLSKAQQRKIHAESLLAMGMQLPPELMKEVTGLGGWETVSERVVEDERSLASIVKDEQIKQEGGEPLIKGVHKRKVDEEEDAEQSAARRAWGSKLKTYPGGDGGGDGEGGDDLDTLLSGIAKKKPKEEEAKEEEVKDEVEGKEKPLSSIPDIDAPAVDVKKEDEAPVVFKKRKVKR